MGSGQDADNWSIGYEMADPSKKLLTLKAGTARQHKRKRPKRKRLPQKELAAMAVKASARLAAFGVLNDIINKNMVTDAALTKNKMFASLESRDRAFARLLVTSCLRRYGQVQKMIDHCLSKPVDQAINLILHLGLVQLFFLSTTPHAATNTSVELAKQLNHDRASGLINAILRRAIREHDDLLGLTSVTDNLPAPLKTIWTKQYGPEQTSAIMDLLMTTPPLDLTVKPDADRAKLAQHLSGLHIQHHTLRCSFDGDIRKMPHYDEGLWWVQDAAAALCGTLAGAEPGRVIFDLCAAPGGKTAQLAAAGASVTAVDSDAHRLTRLKANLDRLKLSADILHADILSAEFDKFATAAQPDVILLDAPCSATGTIRRRPDILVRNNRLDLNALQAVQHDMLEAALRWVRPDGFVIYATCSMQSEEGEEIIRAVTSDRLAKLDKFSKAELGLFAPALSVEGWARVLPTCLNYAKFPDAAAASDYASGNDGFFIARLRPVAS